MIYSGSYFESCKKFRIRPIRIHNAAQNIMNYFFLKIWRHRQRFLSFGENSTVNFQIGRVKFTIFFLVFNIFFMYCRYYDWTGPTPVPGGLGWILCCLCFRLYCLFRVSYLKNVSTVCCYLFCQYTHCNIIGWWLFFWNFMQLCNPKHSCPPIKIQKMRDLFAVLVHIEEVNFNFLWDFSLYDV